ncbi:MAG: serine/threonine-protein kinase [Bacteroidota bacterium]
MIGRKLSNFHINELLGEGGMGTVYKASDLNLQRKVAIKMLHPFLVNNPDSFKRFQNEAQLSARISHPNVATLYNFQKADDAHFIVMEFVDGKALDEVLKLQVKIPESEAVKISLQVLEGLGAAHDLGIMHRDLKPGNIMINQRGFVKLMDFGIARLENTARMTRQNSVIGTLEYLAPELIKGEEPSKASDLYAVGVMLYEMLSGKTLFAGDSEASLMYKIAHVKPDIDLRGLDKKLEKVIRKLTHKQVSKRYQHTRDAIRDLEKIHQNAKVNTLLLKEKLSEKPEATGKLPLKSPKLPSFDIPKFEEIRLPFDMDKRILAGALLFCIFIVSLNFFRASSDSPSKDTPTIPNPEEQASDQQMAASRINPNSLSMGQEKGGEGIKMLERFDTELAEGSTPSKPGASKPLKEKRDKQNKKGNKENRSNPLKSTQKREDSQNKSLEEERGHQKEKIEQREVIQESPKEELPLEREETAPSPPKKEEKSRAKRSVKVRIPDMFLAASFVEQVSTETHQEGQYVYLQTQSPIYYGDHLIVASGSRLMAQIKKLRRAVGKKKAFLSIQLISVQASNGLWLAVSYPEYSNLSKAAVVFKQGQQINKIKLKSTNLTLTY